MICDKCVKSSWQRLQYIGGLREGCVQPQKRHQVHPARVVSFSQAQLDEIQAITGVFDFIHCQRTSDRCHVSTRGGCAVPESRRRSTETTRDRLAQRNNAAAYHWSASYRLT